MSLEDIEFIKAVIALGAAVAAMVTIFKFVIRPVTLTLASLYNDLADTKSRIHFIFQELTPNGGGSVKDTINRVDYLLTLNNSKQRALIQDVEEGVVETDNKGHVVWVNRTCLKKIEATQSEVLGVGWINTIHPDDREEVLKNWSIAVDNGIDLDQDFRLRFNGLEVNAHAKSHALKDVLGKLIGHLTLIYYDED